MYFHNGFCTCTVFMCIVHTLCEEKDCVYMCVCVCTSYTECVFYYQNCSLMVHIIDGPMISYYHRKSLMGKGEPLPEHQSYYFSTKEI